MSDYLFPLDSDAEKYCEENLHETPTSRTASLAALREWSASNPQLRVNTSTLALLQFLRCCKFDIERTKNKIADFYTMRRDVPEWYQNRDPLLPAVQDLANLGVFVPLKGNHNKQLVVIIRTAVHNPKNHKQDDVFKVGNMILDIATRHNQEAQIYGIVAIFDMDGVGLGHARVMTPSIIKKAVRSWQNYHCRPKRLDFVNAPTYINVVLNIFKSFMREKMKERVKVHFDGLEGLWRVVPKEVLPREYGGAGQPLTELIEYWKRKLLDNKEWFEQEEKFRAE